MGKKELEIKLVELSEDNIEKCFIAIAASGGNKALAEGIDWE